jgi:hypothetical protein
MTINVTQEDIDKGVRRISDCCPVALSLFRLGYTGITVEHDEVFLTTEHDDYVFALPDTVAEFIRDFDRRDEVSPFSFELEIPA